VSDGAFAAPRITAFAVITAQIGALAR